MAENNNNDKELLLDLTTSKTKSYIIINDTKYWLIDIDELSIVDRMQSLRHAGEVLSNFTGINTVEDEKKYDDVLKDILALIMIDVSESFLNEISISKKLKIVTAYLESSGLLKKNTNETTSETIKNE